MSVKDDTSRGKKRVRLLQEPIVVTITADMSDLERDLTWWRQEDFEEAKESVKRMCRGLRKERRFSNSLTYAYEHACDMPYTTSASLSTSNQSPLDSIRTNPEFTVLFGDHGPRGLERLSSRLHAMRRQRHLQEIKRAVFLEQARQNISNQPNSELLARQAEFASRKPRAFASLLGHADAWAVESETVETCSDSQFAASTIATTTVQISETASAELLQNRNPEDETVAPTSI